MANVLVVDDDSQIRTLLKMILEVEGLSCDLASDGVEALEMQARNPASLVLLDYMLPKLDGREVFLELRRRGDMTPVIFLSAQPDVQERTQDLDHSGVLLKPFHMQALIDAVRARLTPSSLVEMTEI